MLVSGDKRAITDGVDRLVEFYKKIMGVSAERPVAALAELVVPS